MRSWMIVVALAALAPSAGAQGPEGPEWSAWQGCWNVRMDATRGPADASDAPPDGVRAPRVCVTAEGGTATITTEVDGRLALTQRLVADGAERPFTDGACTGTQQVDWSADRRRLFARARLTCAERTPRTVSGVSLLAPDGTWIEAQAIEAAGRSSVRVRRFVREERAARPVEAHRLTIDDVKEASTRVAAPALEAALVESQATFALTARRLVELQAAEVPDSVIDVMVALTFPQSFTLRPAARADRLTSFPFEMEASDPTYGWWLPTYAEEGGYFDSAYFLSPFGYSYLGSYPVIFGIEDGGFGGGGGRGGGGRKGGTREARVVNGLGYTRLAPRDARPAAGGSADASSAPSGSRGTATTRGYTRSAEPASSSSSSSGSTSSTSSGGSTSGSSDGGRTAVDR